MHYPLEAVRERFEAIHWIESTSVDPDNEMRFFADAPTKRFNVLVTPTFLCVSYTRKEPLPGEDWKRGSDMLDGPNDRDTLNRMVSQTSHLA